MELLMYKSNDCGACKLLENELHRLEALAGTKVFKINLSEEPHRRPNFINSLPAIVLITEGGSVKKFEGYAPADHIFNELTK